MFRSTKLVARLLSPKVSLWRYSLEAWPIALIPSVLLFALAAGLTLPIVALGAKDRSAAQLPRSVPVAHAPLAHIRTRPTAVSLPALRSPTATPACMCTQEAAEARKEARARSEEAEEARRQLACTSGEADARLSHPDPNPNPNPKP